MSLDKASSDLFSKVFAPKMRKGEIRKYKIIEAFIDCLNEEGLDKTSFDSVGKRVKMHRTHVAYYFANRDELIATAVKYVVGIGQKHTVGHLEKAQTAEARLKATIEGPFVWFEQAPKHASVMALFYYFCTCDDEFLELQTMIREGGRKKASWGAYALCGIKETNPR